MTHERARAGFTLIEILIVVVIMSVLAAVLIPQFSTTTNESREASLKHNLTMLRTQIEIYKAYHLGAVPNGAYNLQQLTSATDSSGAVSPTGVVDATHPLGPYVQGGVLPMQAISGRNTVKIDTGAAGSTPSATPSPGGGWIYRVSTGELWVDHPDYLAL